MRTRIPAPRVEAPVRVNVHVSSESRLTSVLVSMDQHGAGGVILTVTERYLGEDGGAPPGERPASTVIMPEYVEPVIAAMRLLLAMQRAGGVVKP